MKIPYVIDNQAHRLADLLNELLGRHQGRSLDVATAYFTAGGFGLIKDGLLGLGNFRLLLGAEPTTGEQIGLRPDVGTVKGLLRKDLEMLPFDEKTLRLIEDLIGYLRRDTVQVRLHERSFLHGKCWLFYSDRPGQQMLFDRFRPILAIVGSSNFTIPGLTSISALATCLISSVIPFRARLRMVIDLTKSIHHYKRLRLAHPVDSNLEGLP